MNDTDRRLRVAMAAADMAIWDSSIVNGKIGDGTIYWSSAGAALIGLPREELAQPFTEFLNIVAPADQANVQGTMQAGVDRGDGYALEYCVDLPSGEPRWLAAKAQIVLDGAGLPIRTLGVRHSAKTSSRLFLARNFRQLFGCRALLPVANYDF
jgi:PAS domain-containing protein